jgi:hypothetical protein
MEPTMTHAYRRLARTVALALPRLCLVALAACGTLLTPAPAAAQSDKWEVEIAPLYFWAARLDGEIGVNDRNVPIFMSFDDALDKLGGTFALHVGAQRGRWGVLADVYFLRLETDATFTTPLIPREITGEAEVGVTIVETAMTWAVRPGSPLNLLGGLRTYTLSPKLTLTGTQFERTPIDVTGTSVGAFGGVTFRPKLGTRAQFLGRADIGGGQAFTWSSTLGLEYRFTSWLGVMGGFKAFGVDKGDVATDGRIVEKVEYATTQYGPIFSLTFHWAQK